VPFGQLPLLVDGDFKLVQTAAIDRYLGKKLDLYPTDPVEAAKVDEIYEAWTELDSVNPIVNVYRDEQFAVKKKEFFEMASIKIARLAKIYSLDDASFFCGRTQPSIADFKALHICQNIIRLEPTCLDAHPPLKSFVVCCQELPGLKEYLKSCDVPIDIGTNPMLGSQSS